MPNFDAACVTTAALITMAAVEDESPPPPSFPTAVGLNGAILTVVACFFKIDFK